MIYNELPIYNDTEELCIKLTLFVNHLSKQFKYSIGNDLTNISVKLLDCIYMANKTFDKINHLNNFYDFLNYLKIRIKLLNKICLNINKKEVKDLQILIFKIEKQIIGWKKHSEK